MPSPLFVGLSNVLARLRTSLIVGGPDYTAFSDADQDRALGYRLLASAAIEDFVEQRGREAASEGAARFLKSQPTRAGRALVAWHVAKTSSAEIPVKPSDFIPQLELVNSASTAYGQMASSTHGMSSKDARKLLFPVGLVPDSTVEGLFDRLDQLSGGRNVAAHVRVNRARSLQPPDVEASLVESILAGLEHVDDLIERAIKTE